MGWLKQSLTGPDNRTVAIGRVISYAITVVLLLCIPVTAVATVIIAMVKVDDWRQLLEALGIYVPLIVGAITALIRITNPTEPPPDNGGGASD